MNSHDKYEKVLAVLSKPARAVIFRRASLISAGLFCHKSKLYANHKMFLFFFWLKRKTFDLANRIWNDEHAYAFGVMIKRHVLRS